MNRIENTVEEFRELIGEWPKLTQEQQELVDRFAENFIKVNAIKSIDAIKLSLLFKIKEDFYKSEDIVSYNLIKNTTEKFYELIKESYSGSEIKEKMLRLANKNGVQ